MKLKDKIRFRLNQVKGFCKAEFPFTGMHAIWIVLVTIWAGIHTVKGL